MAICVDCEREMTTAASCTVTTLHIGELPFPLARHRRSGDGRCGYCGVEPGGYHHLGCDLARCPRCARQLITCGCPFKELEDGEAFDDLDPDGDALDDGLGYGGLWPEREDGVAEEDEEDEVDEEEVDEVQVNEVGDDVDPLKSGGPPGELPWEQVCPRCGSAAVIPILYGIRNPTSAALEAHGVLELGESTDPGRPTSRCKECDHGWTLGRRSA
jgi:hypothetical protein